MATIPSICDAIIIHDVLHKRKVHLDAFTDGLEEFKIKSGINAFPDLFCELFVASSSCSPEDVISIICLHEVDDEKMTCARYLKGAIKKMCESGNTIVTPYMHGIGR